MSTIVMTPSVDEQDKLIDSLKSSQVSSNNPYIRFAAKVDGVSISLYTSGKLVFQGNTPEKIASRFGYIAEEATNSPLGKTAMIGTDEVGNGSYFGGLAVVASYVTPDDYDFLKRLGVADSKTLSDKNIRQIAPLLKERIPHRALLLAPKKYNEVVGPDKDYNAVSVKVALHNQAIFLLLEDGIQTDTIVIDAFTSKKNYDKYLSRERNHFSTPVTLVEKAESQYLAVAVSSIIARDLFLENLDKLSSEVGYTLPSGAGHQSDKVASQLLTAYGMSSLEHTAKLHFANTKKAIALVNKNR